MKDYQFVACTTEAEKKIAFVGAGALLLPAVVLLVIFKGFLPQLIPNQGLLWLVVLAPSFLSFSSVMRMMQKHYIGRFMLRLEGCHVSLVHPDQTVTDLGKVQHVSLNYTDDYKRADLSLQGSKDVAQLRLRSAASWNGCSSAKDFLEVDSAVNELRERLAQKLAA